MKLIVGLGNPGEKYQKTRHNIGFEVINLLAKELEIDNFREKFQGIIGETRVKDEKVFLLKPTTFMNLSGNSIAEVAKFYKIDTEDIIIIYDDMDLKPGQIKIKEKGSAGGHNGIKSIISHFGQEFLRIKCGIGKAKTREETVNFVLGKFSKVEREEYIDELILKAMKASKSLITAKDKARVIQKYNKK